MFKISVIGLGKLGSCHAAVLAYKGYEVIGSDINPKFVESINAGKAPVSEPGLQDLIDKSKARLFATSNTSDAVRNSDVTFLIVPTPSDKEGRFSVEYALSAAKDIGEGLKNKDSYHVVVMTSTVMPGDTEAQFIPAIEKASGKKIGQDFGVCYNPEFIALGSVVKNMLNPDVVLIGESDQKAGDIIEQIYKSSVTNSPFYARMNLINAELTKISINSYITTKITFANTLTQICSNLKDADAKVVLEAVGNDSRIGTKFLKPGLSYGGPCLPRDNLAFSKVAEDSNVEAIIAEATDKANNKHTQFVGDQIQKHITTGNKVALLGLSYKPDTPVIDVSPAISLARHLINNNFKVLAYDPQAMENTMKEESRIILANSLNEAVEDADIVVISTAWNEFRSLKASQLKPDTFVIDCWGIVDSQEFGNKLIRLGKS